MTPTLQLTGNKLAGQSSLVSNARPRTDGPVAERDVVLQSEGSSDERRDRVISCAGASKQMTSILSPGESYDSLAQEYYLPHHKTCRNFEAATGFALQQVNAKSLVQPGLILDVGSGRGQCLRFLDARPEQVVQVDASTKMLCLEDRELCLLRVVGDATKLPFLDGQFATVAAFLCDPYVGPAFFAQARRVLTSGGAFIATSPSAAWGHPLRRAIGLPLDETRFLTESGCVVRVPSRLLTHEELRVMLTSAGFGTVTVSSHRLPAGTAIISDDILTVTQDALSLDILDVITATAL